LRPASQTKPSYLNGIALNLLELNASLTP